MADISKINGYNLKDRTARQGVDNALNGLNEIGEGLNTIGSTMNAALNNFDREINNLKNKDTEHDTKIANLINKDAEFNQNFADLNGTLTGFNNTLSRIDGRINENSGKIETLETSFNEQNEVIEGLQSEVETLKELGFGVVKTVVPIPANTSGSNMAKLYDVRISLPTGLLIENCEFWWSTMGLTGLNADQYVCISGTGNTDGTGYVNFRVSDAPFWQATDFIIKLFYMKVGV